MGSDEGTGTVATPAPTTIPLEDAPQEPTVCKVCWCEFALNPATVPPGTRLACPVCRTPC